MTAVLRNPWFAILVPALVGFGAAVYGIRAFERYALVLFIGVPILVSFLSAFCTSYRREVTYGRAYWTAVASQLALGLMILLVAMDGLICLLMALPLAMFASLIGALVGIAVGASFSKGAGTLVPLLAVVMFPGLVAFEGRTPFAPPLRQVVTSVEIDAPIARVWDVVVAFPKITSEPAWIFKAGVACPIEARIEGVGKGAIRYCTFSTGDFVEPITQWDAPHLLAFDVRSSPAPMEEFSPYEHVDAAHLHGHLRSERGQFRLIEKDGKVILEGTTWYRHEMAPQWYWGRVSDSIIHEIHQRVLDHIKEVAEEAGSNVRPN